VVHVMRRDAERARDFAERHGVARWSTDAQAVIDDPEVTAVYVATPTATHAQYAIAAAQAGKHVLVEKPMAMSSADAGQIVEAADAAGVRFWAAYYRRALPHFVKIRQLLEGDGSRACDAVGIGSLVRPVSPRAGSRGGPR